MVQQMSAIKLRLKKWLCRQSSLLVAAPCVCLLSLSLCLLVLLENDYLNAIYNREWEGQRGGNHMPPVRGEVSGRGRGHLRGRGGEGGEGGEARMLWLKQTKKRRTDGLRLKRSGCRWPSLLQLSLSPPRDTNHPALCLPVSHFYSGPAGSQWLPESLGCCSQAFISPVGSTGSRQPSVKAAYRNQCYCYDFRLRLRNNNSSLVQAAAVIYILFS